MTRKEKKMLNVPPSHVGLTPGVSNAVCLIVYFLKIKFMSCYILITVSPPCSHPIPSPPWHSTFIIKVEYRSTIHFFLCVKPLRDKGEKKGDFAHSFTLLSVPHSWSQNIVLGAMWWTINVLFVVRKQRKTRKDQKPERADRLACHPVT